VQYIGLNIESDLRLNMIYDMTGVRELSYRVSHQELHPYEPLSQENFGGNLRDLSEPLRDLCSDRNSDERPQFFWLTTVSL
jgi:hypothetical protein